MPSLELFLEGQDTHTTALFGFVLENLLPFLVAETEAMVLFLISVSFGRSLWKNAVLQKIRCTIAPKSSPCRKRWG